MGSMQLPPVVLCLPVPTLFSGGDGGNCYKLINIVSQICDNCLFPFTLWGVNMCRVISNFPHLFFLTARLVWRQAGKHISSLRKEELS